MFNVLKALKKLDSLMFPSGYIKIEELREVLFAGQDDSVEERNIKIGGYQELALRIEQINKRLQSIEEKCGCKVKFKESVNERLARLESELGRHESRFDGIEERLSLLQKQIDVLKDFSHDHGGKGMTFPYNPDYGPEKPVTDKPSEFISIPRDVAEKYIRYVEANDAPEAIKYYRSRQDVIDAIKQQLG